MTDILLLVLLLAVLSELVFVAGVYVGMALSYARSMKILRDGKEEGSI